MSCSWGLLWQVLGCMLLVLGLAFTVLIRMCPYYALLSFESHRSGGMQIHLALGCLNLLSARAAGVGHSGRSLYFSRLRPSVLSGKSGGAPRHQVLRWRGSCAYFSFSSLRLSSFSVCSSLQRRSRPTTHTHCVFVLTHAWVLALLITRPHRGRALVLPHGGRVSCPAAWRSGGGYVLYFFMVSWRILLDIC